MTFCAGPDVLASKNIDQPLGKYMLEIDLAFPHSYETEGLPELPEPESLMSRCFTFQCQRTGQNTTVFG
jgi:hypothetical protein